MECKVQPGCRWSRPLCTHHTIYWCGATHQCVVGRRKRPCLAATCTMLYLSNRLGGREAASAHAINSASVPGVQRLCVWTFQTEQQKFHSPEKLCARPSALSSCSIINAVSAERMSIVAMLVAWQVLLQILEAVSCGSQHRLMKLKAMKVSQRVRLARTCNHHKKGLIGATRLLILGKPSWWKNLLLLGRGLAGKLEGLLKKVRLILLTKRGGSIFLAKLARPCAPRKFGGATMQSK
ncbi:hypothetical protein IWZ00DRAFT_36910 [Phyllosticta capitalensis]